MNRVEVTYFFEPSAEFKGIFEESIHEAIMAMGGLKSVESARHQVVVDENCHTAMLLCEELPFTLVPKRYQLD